MGQYPSNHYIMTIKREREKKRQIWATKWNLLVLNEITTNSWEGRRVAFSLLLHQQEKAPPKKHFALLQFLYIKKKSLELASRTPFDLCVFVSNKIEVHPWAILQTTNQGNAFPWRFSGMFASIKRIDHLNRKGKKNYNVGHKKAAKAKTFKGDDTHTRTLRSPLNKLWYFCFYFRKKQMTGSKRNACCCWFCFLLLLCMDVGLAIVQMFFFVNLCCIRHYFIIWKKQMVGGWCYNNKKPSRYVIKN